MRLEGLDRRAFPCTLVPQPVDDVVDARLDTMFLGTYHWRLPTGLVPSTGRAARLLTLGRFATWISA